MITEQEAEEICEELGFTLSEAEQSHERVNEYVATLYLEKEIRTSVDLPDGTAIHRHQLVVGPDEREYVVLDLSTEALELVEVEKPMPNDEGHGHTGVGFLGREVLTYGELMSFYEPQFSEIYEDEEVVERVPVWAY